MVGRVLRLVGWLWLVVLTQQGCSKAAPAVVTPSPVEVAVAIATQVAIPLALSYTAQTVGSREVEVRARVSGILLKRLYQEGAVVKQGEVLFQIDPAPFATVVAQAKANLAVMQAGQAQAKRDRDRVLPLFERGLVSAKDRDDAISNLDVATANTQSSAAKLSTAELELSYTTVRAPISGVAGRESRSEGSLITASSDSSLLTRIVQLDPMYVEFSAPEQEAMLLRAALAEHHAASVPVTVTLDAGSELHATLTFIDNNIDNTSGTVRLRAVLNNHTQTLWPGQYVRAQVEGITLPQSISIPRRAVLSAAQGYTVWVIDSNNQAQSRNVKLGRSVADAVLVTDGLQAGERFVLDGVFKVQAGAKIKVAAVNAAVAPTTATSMTGAVTP